MKRFNSILDSVFRIAGLTTVIAILGLCILYVMFRPEPEVGPIFPSDPQGEFIQSPVITATQNKTLVRWIVPKLCVTNEIEFQQVGEPVPNSNDWGGGTADCMEETEGFVCQVDLTNRGLVKDVSYNLQAYSAQCKDHQNYRSSATTFKL